MNVACGNNLIAIKAALELEYINDARISRMTGSR